jgi:hypothetical protein
MITFILADYEYPMDMAVQFKLMLEQAHCPSLLIVDRGEASVPEASLMSSY